MFQGFTKIKRGWLENKFIEKRIIKRIDQWYEFLEIYFRPTFKGVSSWIELKLIVSFVKIHDILY